MTGPAAEDTAVRLEGLVVRFGTGARALTALNGVDAVFPAGRITGLVGPDGAGKTTLMRILAGLLRPSSGQARLFGVSPEDFVRLQPNSVGYMPQRFGLYEDLSVMANLRLYASLRGLEGDERDRLFARLLNFTGLAPFGRRLAGRLSGGMKQKLGIACALLGAPRLLLLDEPGVGVDPQSRRDLWNMVQELSRGGMTVVWSTAYLDEAERCPGVLMLDGGRVLYAGPPQEFTARVAGRVWLLEVGAGHRRAELAGLLTRPGVEDALIQGSRIRLVLAADAPSALRAYLEERGARTAEARLEDAYMSAVGGISHAPSPYRRAHPAKDAAVGTKKSRIAARGLTRAFGSFVAARDISFDVAPGEIFGLLGPNGAGKSTTFRMLCGLLRPTAGTCSVDGVDLLTAGSAARARLGYMAQKFSLYLDIPVQENIRICADLYGLDSGQRARLPRLAEALELSAFLRSPTRTLPLGQKQRLALLCATLHQPPVLFLDEPTSGVDARTRRDFWKHISAMTEEGAAVLVTTHFMEEAEYCDRIALIYRGSMISMGTPDELKASCASAETPTLEEAFIASIEQHDREMPQ